MTKTKIDELRDKLILLRKQRDEAVLQKGLAARENNDLRENFAYDYWEMQERNLTSRILEITFEIEGLAKLKS
jgi:transcription elongation GreA/GreB family factor